MIQKIKKFIFVTIASLTILAPGLVPGIAGVAAANSITDSLCTGSNIAASGGNTNCTTSNSTDSIYKLASKVVNIFSVIVGIVAVVMVIFGGFKYITSGGDSNSISGAKNTLIYAIIGLIIVALAQFIVHFVLSTANNTGLTG